MEKALSAVSSICVAIVAVCNVISMILSNNIPPILIYIIIGFDAIVVVLLLAVLVYKLLYSKILFSDSFKTTDKWIGPTSPVITNEEDHHGAYICGHDLGVQTSIGYLWENIELSFKAKVIKNCFGIVVRAQDEQNFFMFQLGIDKKITPHKRIRYVDVSLGNGQAQTGGGVSQGFAANVLKSGWIKYPQKGFTFSGKIEDWNDYKIVLNKKKIQISINNEIVYHDDSIIDWYHGRIGFRCYDPEKVCVADVRVKSL